MELAIFKADTVAVRAVRWLVQSWHKRQRSTVEYRCVDSTHHRRAVQSQHHARRSTVFQRHRHFTVTTVTRLHRHRSA